MSILKLCIPLSRRAHSCLLISIFTDSMHERQMDMTAAKTFWRQVLLGYNLEKPINLPSDRKFSLDDTRTGQGLRVEIHFESHIVEQLVNYAADCNSTLYQVCLTIYYIFLFKLTGGQRDLIVGIVHANRYRPELQHIIGMFVNTLPMRVRVDSQDTFQQLHSKVSSFLFEAYMHSHLPYQSIIGHLHERNLIQTMFTLDEVSVTPIQLDDNLSIDPWTISRLNNSTVAIGMSTNTVSMFDMTLSMEYTVETHTLRAELLASSDLFDSITIMNIAHRFRLLVEQLLSSSSIITTTTVTSVSICDFSLILPDEMVEDMHYKQLDPISGINLISTTFTIDI
jgi:hypothetical protein